MLEIEGYRLDKQLEALSRARLWSAVRERDGCAVVLKQYLDDGKPGAKDRGVREFMSLRAVEGSSVVRALEVLTDVAPSVLVLEHVPGIVLTQWVRAGLPDEHAFLEVAIQLVGALSRVHQARLIHRDLGPGNMMVDPDSLAACLMDLGSAVQLGTASRGRFLPSSLPGGGGMAYAAPEQTGRMGRGIDTRSDLYAMGATFYFALTGRPPFDSDDPLALVHAHLARLPPSPREWRPDLSEALARIVLKLLEKEPEERYQTAEGLLRDLAQCRDELARTGRMDAEMALGTADAPSCPVFGKTLYGREEQTAELLAAYERVRAGAAELVVLSGNAGVGKSAVVDAIRRSVAEVGGYLCVGTFDAYGRQTPYVGLLSAFDALLHQMLCEDDESLAQWRERLHAHLGAVAGVLVDLLPNLALVFDRVDPVPPLGPREARARLALAIQRFVEACARPDHPLVLVLDDMHPSDRASRDLLVELLATSRSASLLVVVALRDSEGTGEKDVDEFLARLRESEVPVTELTLPPLDLACVSQLLADVLARDPQGCRDLAETFLLKTGGNPLLIREFLLRMHEEGGIRFEPGKGWQWDLEAIVAADLLEGAVGLMIDKLERLASGEIEMLKLSSCVGDAFDVTLLCDVTHLEREVVEPALFGLADAGLLLPSRLGFRFAHGRIREAARALLSDEDRARLHCDIGRRLLERTSPEDLGQRCLMIADHLNRGRSYIEEPFRRSALVVGLQAGEAALAAGAATAADTYLAAARELLRDEDWEGGEVRVLALFLQSAEALHQIGETDRALGLLDRLEARRLERIELGFVLAKRVRVLTGQRPADAVEAARASLHRLGVRWPREPSWLRLWLETFHTDWALRGPLGVSRFAIVDRRNLDWAPPLAVIAESGPAMIQRAPRLLALATMYSLRVLARHGTPRPIAVAFAAYAAIHADFRGHAQGIERYVAAAEEWIEQTSDPLNVRAEWSLLYFSRAWLQERRPSIEPLARVSERLREVGALDYATHASQARFACLALTGEPLDRVADEVAEMRRHEHWPGMRSFLELFPYTYGLLRLDTVRPIDWDRASESAEPSLRKLSLLGRIHWVFTLCVLGEYRRVEAEVRRTGLEELPRTPLVAPDFMLCRGVAAAGLAHTLRGRARRRCVRTVRESLRWLRHRMARQPDCAHMIRILEAELAFARGREGEAFRLYPAAATGAQTRGYVHHAALAHDRHATLLRQARREHEARSVLLQAIEAYREWGALARIRQLEGRRELRHRTDR